ncbi:hypothetical protein ElyMa_001900600 [Elysia marginata]|uniref:Uncharacterized protein n=1 Tax=Elysia marginata TaxID=1093978 RepID=A0AAV4EST7_9GAST|nr:hypothetical protein ElyMa_001900600 [Elysia marginata]
MEDEKLDGVDVFIYLGGYHKQRGSSKGRPKETDTESPPSLLRAEEDIFQDIAEQQDNTSEPSVLQQQMYETNHQHYTGRKSSVIPIDFRRNNTTATTDGGRDEEKKGEMD